MKQKTEELYENAKEDKCMAQILREVAVTRMVTSTGKQVTHGKWLPKPLSGVVARDDDHDQWKILPSQFPF